MIEIKEAVNVAKNFVQSVFEGELPELRLEEVDRSDDNKFWLITLGFTSEKKGISQLAKVINPLERIYKTIKVDAEKGEAVSMRIREI